MSKTGSDKAIEVRVFGALRKHLDRQDIPCFFQKQLPSASMTPADIAGELDIPPNEIEAVFVNGRVRDRNMPLSPGDRVGFSPMERRDPIVCFWG